MKEWKITSEKQLNNSETCTCICHGYYGYTCKVGRPNIDALATAIITVHSFIAMQMPDSEYSVVSGHEDMVFARTTILHSTAVLN